jgi:pimeloyl-ACP methyl ester carboxylesterase
MRSSLVLVLVVLLAGCAGSTSVAATPSPSPSPSATRVLTGSIGGATYTIELPVTWNGTLFLYSHGYVEPGAPNPASAAPDRAVAKWLLDRGYALAGSSFSSTGWAVEDALKDQIALLDHFTQAVGKPARVIAIGASLGGIITAGLVQTYPDRFAAAIPVCGVLAGGVAAWNTALDGAYAFKTLLAPTSKLQVVHITDPAGNLQLAQDLVAQALLTQAGQARIALMAALSDLPGWFVPTSPAPAPTDYPAMAAAQAQWETRIDFAFAFSNRAELEARAGGNPSWNAGVDYARQLAISADRAEVAALYAAAGLDLAADLRALNAGATIEPDPQAAAYLDRNISFDGRLTVPVLTMHTTADGLVVPQDETAYADVVRSAGSQDLLRQIFVQRAGHCAFTSAEVIALIEVMLQRLDTGHWDAAALTADALNGAALQLGVSLNAIGGLFPANPAFAAFAAGPYPRPFPKGSAPPA